MAVDITNKGTLKTALAGELHRTDLTDKLDRFVLMGESRLNRELLMQDMVTTATGNLSTLVRTLALPTRYLDKVSFRLNDPLTDLAYVPPGRLLDWSSSNAEAGQPKRFTVTDAFEFDKVPDAAYAYTLKYYRGYLLSDDSDTNYVLANYPQAYLYAACQYAAMHCRNYRLAEAMAAMAGAEIRTIKRTEKRRRSEAEATLVTDLPVGSGNSYNIDHG